jgi:hypothetical protein
MKILSFGGSMGALSSSSIGYGGLIGDLSSRPVMGASSLAQRELGMMESGDILISNKHAQ